MTGSLAWPVVVAAIAIGLRKQIQALAGRLVARFAMLTELSGLGVSLKFTETLDELEMGVKEIKEVSAADRVTASDEATVVKRDEFRSEVPPVVQSDEPLVTLLEAYRVVELAVWRALERHGLGGNRKKPLQSAIRTLQSNTVADSSLLRLVDDLVSLRKQAVHELVPVDRNDAERYTWIAADIAEYLDGL